MMSHMNINDLSALLHTENVGEDEAVIRLGYMTIARIYHFDSEWCVTSDKLCVTIYGDTKEDAFKKFVAHLTP